jgi:hypothetical protein
VEGGVMDWVVVLELVPANPPDIEEVQRLLWELEDLEPLAMRSDERYALQLLVAGGQPEEALATAVWRWRVAAERLLLGTATFIRSEVMTPAELEQDIKAADKGEPLVASATAIHRDPVVRPDPVVRAVLAVLAGADPEHVAKESGLNPRQLIRWCDLFVEGGRMRLAGTPAPRREHDLRSFDLSGNECRRALEVLSEQTLDLARLAPEANGADGPWRELSSGIDRLRRYVNELTEAVAATRRDVPLEPVEIDLPERR